jgi:uncharacterized small protein (DUF1192 family)
MKTPEATKEKQEAEKYLLEYEVFGQYVKAEGFSLQYICDCINGAVHRLTKIRITKLIQSEYASSQTEIMKTPEFNVESTKYARRATSFVPADDERYINAFNHFKAGMEKVWTAASSQIEDLTKELEEYREWKKWEFARKLQKQADEKMLKDLADFEAKITDLTKEVERLKADVDFKDKQYKGLLEKHEVLLNNVDKHSDQLQKKLDHARFDIDTCLFIQKSKKLKD